MRESRLLRAFGTPAIADEIRIPGYRPTYSCRLGYQMSMPTGMQACHVHSRLVTLSRKKSQHLLKCWDRISCGATRLDVKHPLNAYYHMLSFDYEGYYSVSHTWKFPFCSPSKVHSIISTFTGSQQTPALCESFL